MRSVEGLFSRLLAASKKATQDAFAELAMLGDRVVTVPECSCVAIEWGGCSARDGLIVSASPHQFACRSNGSVVNQFFMHEIRVVSVRDRPPRCSLAMNLKLREYVVRTILYDFSLLMMLQNRLVLL
ncbi:hypothetical protein N9053_00610 [bacterium]|nr:hypothetical protein [Rubripirellula sp.]MDB4557626.1 hypothetical protein [bacterium]MDB4624910.1 hypothetical protein [Rubripirellula sp.]MDB4770477.1 hypothetical protein [bacterium]